MLVVCLLIKKDTYHLPNIDKSLDKLVGFKSLLFIDACSRNNQTPMDHNGNVKTMFLIDEGILCYKVITSKKCKSNISKNVE